MNYLKECINKSITIIRETKAQFNKPAILWSTGKDSTTVLNLVRASFFGQVPFPVIFIETGFQFKETIEFRDRIAANWDLNLIICKKASKTCPFISKFSCCHTRKTEALKELLFKEQYDALIVSIRRDEHYMRNIERFMSPRDKNFRYQIIRPKVSTEFGSPYESLQDAELAGWNLFVSDFGPEISHVRVHPILHCWYEIDIWKYIKLNNLPVNPLYFSGYRSLGCEPCTKPVWEPVSSIDEIIERLKTSKLSERAGRDSTKEDIMRKLRALGYL